MLSATRHKKLLLALLLLAGSAVVAFAAYRIRDAVLYSRLSATEKQVIGVWTWTAIDATGYMRIRPNHRFDQWSEDYPDARYVTHGAWSIEGAEFVYIHDPGQLSEELRDWKPPHIPLSDFGAGMMKVH